MINYNYVYVLFLVIVLVGAVVTVGVDFRDKGECRKGLDDNFFVRSPGSKSFVAKEFCVLIQS